MRTLRAHAEIWPLNERTRLATSAHVAGGFLVYNFPSSIFSSLTIFGRGLTKLATFLSSAFRHTESTPRSHFLEQHDVF